MNEEDMEEAQALDMFLHPGFHRYQYWSTRNHDILLLHSDKVGTQ